MKSRHSLTFSYPCPTCEAGNTFHVLWVDSEPSLAGPTLCVECGKPFSSSKVLEVGVSELEEKKG